MSYFVVKQLPVPPPDSLSGELGWLGTTPTQFMADRALELCYTSWSMRSAAISIQPTLPPFRWEPARREALRCELDGLVFAIAGTPREDVVHILDSFPKVQVKDEAEFGEYRTKRLILERYDAMVDAEAAGREYETILDPPPADPSLCHPESTRPDWAR